MRILFCLLFGIAARSVANAQPTKAIFAPELLRPDLQEISKYYENGGTMPVTYMQVHKSITFKVQLVNVDGPCLQMDGQFTFKSTGGTGFNSLYFKDNEFFVYESGGQLHKISLDDLVLYSATPMTRKKPFLFVKYCDIETLREDTDELYNTYREYIEASTDINPGTYLAIHPDGPFVEFSFWSNNLHHSTASEVQVISGRISGDYVWWLSKTRSSKLVFDQRKHVFTVFDSYLEPVKDALSFRTANEAVLTEVFLDVAHSFSTSDLYLSKSLPLVHQVSEEELLEKAKTVEPRFSQARRLFLPDKWLKEKLFQVHGIFFIKRLNYHGDKIDAACPFIIECGNQGKRILFEGRWVNKVCTDDSKLSAFK